MEAAFVPLPQQDGQPPHNADANDHQDLSDRPRDRTAANQRGHMYTLLNQKSREVIEKWSSVPVAATKLMNILNAFDSEMGDPSSYRTAGAASSRPTPSNGAF